MGRYMTGWGVALALAAVAGSGLAQNRYQYWFDADLAAVKGGVLTGSSYTEEIDVSTLTSGLHWFNYRMADEEGNWGAPYTKAFLISGADGFGRGAAGYEYWIDQDYANRVKGSLTSAQGSYTVDVAGYNRGLHTFTYRICNERGEWGAPYTRTFFARAENSAWTAYEYWFDNDYENRTGGATDGSGLSFDIDVSGLEKRGPHFFNLRGRNDRGEWGSVYHKLIVFFDRNHRAPLTAYRHSINGIDLGGDKFAEGDTAKTRTLLVDIPEGLELTGTRTISWEGDVASVSSNDSIQYTLMLQSEEGWGAPAVWNVPVGEDFSDTATEMKVPSSLTFAKPAAGRFKAVKFETDGRDLFFSASQEASMQIFDGGEEVMTISLTDESQLNALPKGTYHAVVSSEQFNTTPVLPEGQYRVYFDNSESNWDTPYIWVWDETLNYTGGVWPGEPMTYDTKTGYWTYTFECEDPGKLMCIFSNNGVPQTADLTFTNQGIYNASGYVKIYGKSNVKALADDDQMTLYILDSAEGLQLPVIEFNDGMVTMSTTYDGAEIHYTLDGSVPTAESTLYESPIPIDHNVWVRAITTLPGSDIPDSAVAELVIDTFSVEAPVITFENRQIVITADASATTYYTLDGTVPSEESARYTAPFTLTEDATVKARSYREGFRPSEVTTFDYVVADYTVAAPTLSVGTDGNNAVVTITCADEDAVILYGVDNPDPAQMSGYTAPVTLTRNGTVYAMARKSGLFDSEVVSVAVDLLAVPAPEIEYVNRTVVIREPVGLDVKTYYTLDGTDPEAPNELLAGGNGTLYTAPLTLSGDITVKARSYSEGLQPSPVVSFDYFQSSYMVSAPSMSVEVAEDAKSAEVTIECVTAGAEIWYGVDNSDITAMTRYSGPITLTQNGTVYAQARKEGYFDSEVTSRNVDFFAVGKPTISFENRQIVITADASATTYYTLDGTVPSEESARYTAPFTLTEDATVKAVSYRDGFQPSEVAIYEYYHSDHVVAAPEINYDFEAGSKSATVHITTETEGATLWYGINNDDVEAMLPYEKPVTVTQNCLVFAQARKEGMFDSEVQMLDLIGLMAGEVTLSYDGRYVTLSSDEGTEIYYSIDNDSEEPYYGPFDLGGLHNVTATGRKAGVDDTYMPEFSAMSYGREGEAMIGESGSLADAFAWTTTEEVDSWTELKVWYFLNSSEDYAWLRARKNLETLDLSNVVIDSEHRIPSQAFANMQLLTLHMPCMFDAANAMAVTSGAFIGNNIFEGASQLSALYWNAQLPTGVLTMPQSLAEQLPNRNLLLYSDNAAAVANARPYVNNIVIGGRAEKLTLTEGGGPWYCPEAFVADRATYIRSFDKTTAIDSECAGWESIALPFDVAKVSHLKGRLTPFADETDEGILRYWLFAPASNDWEEATNIYANTPYLLAMPNNAAYDEVYNLGGEVTFSAENVEIPATPDDMSRVLWGDMWMTANYRAVAAEESVMVVNDDWYEGNDPGSMFVAGLRDVRPFEAYLTGGGRKSVRIFDTSRVGELLAPLSLRVWSDCAKTVSILSGRDRRIRIYDTTGALVRVVDVRRGETTVVRDLAPGVYIVDRVKIII